MPWIMVTVKMGADDMEIPIVFRVHDSCSKLIESTASEVVRFVFPYPVKHIHGDAVNCRGHDRYCKVVQVVLPATLTLTHEETESDDSLVCHVTCHS